MFVRIRCLLVLLGSCVNRVYPEEPLTTARLSRPLHPARVVLRPAPGDLSSTIRAMKLDPISTNAPSGTRESVNSTVRKSETVRGGLKKAGQNFANSHKNLACVGGYKWGYQGEWRILSPVFSIGMNPWGAETEIIENNIVTISIAR